MATPILPRRGRPYFAVWAVEIPEKSERCQEKSESGQDKSESEVKALMRKVKVM